MEKEFITVKPGEDLSEVLKVRGEIFSAGEDDMDEIAINVILADGGRYLACGRLLLDLEDDRLIIDQIGVIKEMRGQGLASMVTEKLTDIARECDSADIWAKTHNNQAAISLLEKLGFEELNPYWMTKDLS